MPQFEMSDAEYAKLIALRDKADNKVRTNAIKRMATRRLIEENEGQYRKLLVKCGVEYDELQPYL